MSTLPNSNAFSGILALSGIIQVNNMLETRMINSDTGQIQYIGWTNKAGAATSASVWYVVALYYDSNGFLNYFKLPNNGPGMIYIWDDVSDYF